MGWLLLGSGLGFILGTDASFYAILAYRLHPGRLPLGWVAVLLNAGWALAFIFLGAAVVLFPDGRLPSQHWRWPWRIYLAVSAVEVGGGIVILLAAVAGHHVQIDSSGTWPPSATRFNPLRRRVQRSVDRRFNRARYDADQTVAAFAARLKDEVDLDSIRADLAGVVQRALEPVHISVSVRRRD